MQIEDWIKLWITLSSLVDTGTEMATTIVRALVRALLKAWIMATGWVLHCECGRACARVSPVRMITVVVPSATCSYSQRDPQD